VAGHDIQPENLLKLHGHCIPLDCNERTRSIPVICLQA
jgi:hypothetical protein